MAYTVTAPMVAVSVPIGAHTSQVWFLGQGSPLPEGIEDASVAHLLSMGMIAESVAEPDLEPAVEPDAPAPRKGRAPSRGKAGAPADSGKELADLTVDQLRAEAAARGIEVPEGVTDPADLVALLSQ